MKLGIAILALSTVALGQNPKAYPDTVPNAPKVAPAAPAQPPVAPTLTETEKVALGSIQQQQTAIRQMLRQIEQDIRTNHPGYELQESTLTLVPVKPVTKK